MARKSKQHHKKKFTLPLAIVAGLAPGATYTIAGFQGGGVTGALNSLSYAYGGFDPSTKKFNFAGLSHGTIPLVAGFLIHKVAGGLGINRALANAGIPILRI